MTTDLHQMFGLTNKSIDYKARVMAATEHMKSEISEVFRDLGLEDDNPCKARLVDACNAWVAAATEMVDANADHVERRVMQVSERAIRRMKGEVEERTQEEWRNVHRALRSQRIMLALTATLLGAVIGVKAGMYYSAYTDVVGQQSSPTAAPSAPYSAVEKRP